jgi:membrane-associated phospholipid phosphatase
VKNYTFVDYCTQGYSAFVAILVLLFHNGTVPAWPSIVAAHVAAIALTHVLIHSHAANRTNKALEFLRHFYPVLLYTWFFCETGLLNRMFFTQYLDPAVIRLEETLFGCQPSILLMDKLPYLAISELFYASYFSYYIMIAGIGIALYIRERRHFFHYVSVVSFVFYICYIIYIYLPVIGPRHFFGEMGASLPADLARYDLEALYPEAVQKGFFFKLMGIIYVLAEAPGAALPSSHVAIALTTVFFSFLYLRRIRYIHLAIAILLCISTVYCRYHYAVDVVAGVITAAVLVPCGNWLYFRLRSPALERKLILGPGIAGNN